MRKKKLYTLIDWERPFNFGVLFLLLLEKGLLLNYEEFRKWFKSKENTGKIIKGVHYKTIRKRKVFWKSHFELIYKLLKREKRFKEKKLLGKLRQRKSSS